MNDEEFSFLSRRKFVKGATAAGLLAGFGNLLPAFARPGRLASLRGNPIELSIGEREIEIAGRPALAVAINGTVPGPLLRLREGTEAVVRVRNLYPDRVSTSIPWHGLILPFSDGRGAGRQLSRYRAGRNIHLPLSRSAERHLLVP